MQFPGFAIDRFVQSKMTKVRQKVAECPTVTDDIRHTERNAAHDQLQHDNKASDDGSPQSGEGCSFVKQSERQGKVEIRRSRSTPCTFRSYCYTRMKDTYSTPGSTVRLAQGGTQLEKHFCHSRKNLPCTTLKNFLRPLEKNLLCTTLKNPFNFLSCVVGWVGLDWIDWTGLVGWLINLDALDPLAPPLPRAFVPWTPLPWAPLPWTPSSGPSKFRAVFPLPTLFFFLQFRRSFVELRWSLRVFIIENVFTTHIWSSLDIL